MKFRKIFRFELMCQLQSITTWLYFSVLFLFTLLMNLITTPGDGVVVNNTFYITSIIIIGCLIWLVMAGVIAGEAAARDIQSRMDPLTYTTPASKLAYLGGRFTAAFSLNAMLVLTLPLGIILSFYLPGIAEEGTFLPFRADVYLINYFVIALPNVFVATALQFTFAALSRKVMISYLASFLLVISAQLLGMTTAKLFGSWELVKLLDPVGIVSLVGGELETWTPTEKNTRLISLEGIFLWNRILWVSIGIASLIITYVQFSFTHTSAGSWLNRFKRRPKSKAQIPVAAAVEKSLLATLQLPAPVFGVQTYVRQTMTIGWISFKDCIRNPAGIIPVGLITMASAIFGYVIMTQFGIPLIPTTQQVTDYLTSPVGSVNSQWVVIPLLIMYFAGKLIWRDRDARLSDISDAMPVSEWSLLSGKFLGLGLLVTVWITLLTAAGILMQLLLHYDHFEISLYINVLYGLQLPDYLLFAALALVVHTVVNQKYVGNLVLLLVFIFIAFPGAFRIYHPMLVYGADPGWAYTDMRGFGNTLMPWLWFKVYWIAWALLLLVIAQLLWSRGREQNLMNRLRAARSRSSRATGLLAIISLGLIVTLGGFIFYNTNVLNDYVTVNDISKQKAAYEKKYGQYRNMLQPQLVDTKLKVELYPERQQLEIFAMYSLMNKESIPIDTIHLSSIAGIMPEEIRFHRTAKNIVTDKELGHAIYILDQPLLPGDSVHINFVVRSQAQGFSHRGASELVVKNGTYFTNYDVLPAIGYQRYRELNDAVQRERFNLDARPKVPSLYDTQARQKPMIADQNTVEATIGTALDEVAVAPGVLQRTWTENDRSYFQYKTDGALRGEYAFLSGKYAVQESTFNGIVIRIYYHPAHASAVDRTLRSVQASLAYYTEQFGPYAYTHLTVIERAGTEGSLSSEASMIDYGEQFSRMNPDDGPAGFDLPYYIMAHEVAHQWFGGARLTPANVEGAGVLIESMAVYCGMQVLEKNYGPGHLQQYVSFLHSSYEMPRSLASASLLQADEPFLYYRKGGLALYALSRYIGKDRVNGAIGNLLRKDNSEYVKLPTTLNLYDELKKATPDSLHYFLHDLFAQNTYWRLKTRHLDAVQAKTGDWQVTLTVYAQKVVIDSTGAELDVGMNDWLEIGLYEEGKGLSEPLYLQPHRIRTGEQTIIVTVPRKPARGGIDPNTLTIDLRVDDNMMNLDGK